MFHHRSIGASGDLLAFLKSQYSVNVSQHTEFKSTHYRAKIDNIDCAFTSYVAVRTQPQEKKSRLQMASYAGHFCGP